jgi:hypothetical protein
MGIKVMALISSCIAAYWFTVLICIGVALCFPTVHWSRVSVVLAGILWMTLWGHRYKRRIAAEADSMVESARAFRAQAVLFRAQNEQRVP